MYKERNQEDAVPVAALRDERVRQESLFRLRAASERYHGSYRWHLLHGDAVVVRDPLSE